MLGPDQVAFLSPSPDQLALLIPIIALIIPIVAILTKHQREMAIMYQNNHQQSNNVEVDALRRQVEELRQLANQQTLVLDDIRMTQRQLAASSQEALTQRIEGQ